MDKDAAKILAKQRIRLVTSATSKPVQACDADELEDTYWTARELSECERELRGGPKARPLPRH